MNVHNILTLFHQELISSKTQESYSKSAILTDLLGFQDLFVHHEILPPARRSSAPHTHTSREEMVFVLAGCPIAYLGSQSVQLKPGDFLGFQPGVADLHYIENQTTDEVRLLVICSNPKNDQIHIKSNEGVHLKDHS